MKNKTVFFRLFIIIPIICILMMMVSCNYSDIVSVTFGTDNNNILFGEIDYSDYYLDVKHRNGTVEQVTVTEDMIDENDIFKLYEIGTHDITFYYDNFYTTVTFIVNINHFSEDLKFITNDTYQGEEVFVQKYDGESHSLELTNDYPVDTQIVYPDGNSFSECKSTPYVVRAVLTKDGYEPKEIVGKLLIVSNEFPSEVFDSIVFNDKVETYDGKEKNIEIENLPNELEVEYKIIDSLGRKTENAIDAGVYQITATFKSKNHNYELTKNTLTATLTIEKAPIKINTLSIDDVTKVYDGEAAQVKVFGSTPDGVGYDLIIKDKDGNIITNPKDVGTYNVELVFKTDGNHYPNPEKLTSIITINKKIIDLKDVSYGLDEVSFTGAKQDYSLLKNQIDEFVIPDFKYYLNGVTLCDPVFPGTYTVEISYSIKDDDLKNFEIINIPTDSPILIINEVIDLSFLSYELETVTYDGTKKEYTKLNGKLGSLNSYVLPVFTYYLDGSSESTDPIAAGTYHVAVTYVLDELVENCSIKGIPTDEPILVINSDIE